jgi:hypothetical protein
MVNAPYSTIRYGTLDELLALLARYTWVKGRFEGWRQTAEKYSPLVTEEIDKRRAKGEQTMAEQLKEITGNDFTLLSRR